MNHKSTKRTDLGAILYDQQSGDMKERIAFIVEKGRCRVQDWLAFFHKGTTMLALNKNITKEAYRVFLVMVSYVDYENKICVTQAEIGKILGLRQQHVSRSVRLLVKEGIFLEIGKVGTSKTYELNTEYGWKGDLRKLASKSEKQLKYYPSNPFRLPTTQVNKKAS